MKKIVAILFLVLLPVVPIVSQEVSSAAIIINGQRNTIGFVEVDGLAYLSWADLQRLLPGTFSLSAKGEVVVTLGGDPATMKSLLDALGAAGQYGATGDVIESRIDGEFEGWDGDTIFKLVNGQIWQQDEYAYTYSYKYRPEVTIYRTSSGWKMKVEGESKEIAVKRIK